MNSTFRPPGRTVGLLLCLLLMAAVALAQNYALPWNSINNGGQPGAGTNYHLNGSISQAVIGTGMSAGTYGWWGFWYGWPTGGAPNPPDVGVVSIDRPVGQNESSATIVPAATVKNFGLDPATFDVYFLINGGGTYSDHVTIANLAGGATTTATFVEWPKPHALGSYITRCSTYVAGDVGPGNDTLGGTFSIVVQVAETGWIRKADVPLGGKAKRVKDGGCLAYSEETDATGCIYALKGNNRCEFYKYNTNTNTWVTKESIPAIGISGKKKAVKKGASMTQAEGKMYAVKGNSTLEFWQYTPTTDAYPWVQMPDVPAGGKTIREGSGATAVKLGDTAYVYFLKGSGTQEFYRYNTLTNTWAPMANAPLGTSGRAFKNGSCITFDGTNTIYTLKGTYNEFFAYDVAGNTWTARTTLPLIGNSGKKKKVKDGAGIAYHAGYAYALKGNNTQEFWGYQADSDRWTQKADMPLGGGKKVKAGGGLVYAALPSGLYALKGNNTFEFWKYGLASYRSPLTDYRPENTQSSIFNLQSSIFNLRVSPNPFTGTTTIRYTLPGPGACCLSLYDVTGKLVTTIVAGQRDAGSYSLPAGFSSLASGIYVLKLETEGYSTTQKLIIE